MNISTKIIGILQIIITMVAMPIVGNSTQANESQSKIPFSIINHTISPNDNTAELCLNLAGEDLDIRDRSAVASAIQLKQNGKKAIVSPESLSLTATDLCVQNLPYGTDGSVLIKGVRGRDGGSLAQPFALNFHVPDRKESLLFTFAMAETDTAEMPNYPVNAANDTTPISLSAINVRAAKLQLYRIATPEAIIAAWPQYLRESTVPSESLYLADKRGEQVWQGNIVFNHERNTVQSALVALPPDVITAKGLYFLAALPPSDSITPELMAGKWFVVSNTQIQAERLEKSIKVNIIPPHSDVRVMLVERDGSVQSETTTDNNGTAFLPLNTNTGGETERAAVVTITKTGDINFLSTAAIPRPSPPVTSTVPIVQPDTTIYRGGSEIEVTLSSPAPVFPNNTTIKLERPSGALYAVRKVTDSANGKAAVKLRLPLHAMAGNWRILWQSADNQTISQTAIKVGLDGIWPLLAITSEKRFIEDDGTVVLNLRATAADNGQSLGGHKGRVAWQFMRPTMAGWDGWIFGKETIDNHPNVSTITAGENFVTSADGTAKLRVKIPPSSGMTVVFTASLDGVADTQKLTVPIRPRNNLLVGIRQKTPDFLGNKAIFDLVAVDAMSRRREAKGLFFVIYEEGRSFRWQQADGRWTYTALPNHRRIGGGTINLSATTDNTIIRALKAGRHVLEITDDRGDVLAKYSFDFNPTHRENIPEVSSTTSPLTLTTMTVRPAVSASETISTPSAVITQASLPVRLPVQGDIKGNIKITNTTNTTNQYNYTIALPEFMTIKSKLTGTLLIKSAATITIPLVMTARPNSAGYHGVIRFSLTSGKVMDLLDTWPVAIEADKNFPNVVMKNIAVGASITLPVTKALISSTPLRGAAIMIRQLLDAAPTNAAYFHIATQWLLAVHMWQDNLIAANIVHRENIINKATPLAASLLALQNEDGSFSLTADEAGDMTATAAAVLTMHEGAMLGSTTDDLALAIDWLQKRSENSWVNPEERRGRAYALLALATVGRADIASLRYFSETLMGSTDKEAQSDVVTAAMVSLAFARIKGNEDAAKSWSDRARAGLRNITTDPNSSMYSQAEELFALLSANPIVGVGDLMNDMSKYANPPHKDAAAASTDMLVGTYAMAQRQGSWRIITNPSGHNPVETKHYGVITLPPAPAPLTVRNISENPLYVEYVAVN